MKYKIYCNNKQYKVPSATVYGYGDVIPIVFGEDVAVRLWDGDIAYLKKDYDDGGGYEYCLYISFESGAASSVFYLSIDETHIGQTGSYGWICHPETFQNYGDFVRIYKFEEDTYDIGLNGEENAENNCRKYGKLVGIFQFTTDDEGNEIWRMLDPTINKYNGQWIDLPNMNDRLFISYWFSRVYYGEIGFYYIFESGDEGMGFLKEVDTNIIIRGSYEGWFAHSPANDRELYIYHCGSGWYDIDWDDSISDYYDWDEIKRFFASQNIQPTILRYNEDTELWYLVQEGTRYDY